MSDYLSCGSCPSEFELKEYPDFIEHKLRSCHISNSTNILECLQCFKKFHTSMPLLIHLQRDHHLAIVKMYNLPRAEPEESEAYAEALNSIGNAGIIKREQLCHHRETQTLRTCTGRHNLMSSATNTPTDNNSATALSEASHSTQCCNAATFHDPRRQSLGTTDCCDSGGCPYSPSMMEEDRVKCMSDAISQTDFPLTEHDKDMKFFFSKGSFMESLDEINELVPLTEPYEQSIAFDPPVVPNVNWSHSSSSSQLTAAPCYTLHLYNYPTSSNTLNTSLLKGIESAYHDTSAVSSTASDFRGGTCDVVDPLRSVVKTSRFSCDACSRTFRQKVHLRKHILSHHIHEKPHKCPSCDYSTVEKSHLVVHLRKHTGEKPFRCRECDYSSAQNCTLKNHYFRKHPSSRISCENCQRDFVTDLERENHAKLCLREPQ